MNKRDLILLLLLALAIDLILAGLHLNFTRHEQLFSTLFDLDKEANLPTWYTSFKLTLAGVAALLIYQKEVAYSNKKEPLSYPMIWFWLLIAGLMFFMSADETAQIHETLTRWFMQTLAGARLLYNLEIGKSGGTLVWGLLFSPVLILIAGALIHFYFKRFKRQGDLLVLSVLMLGLFVISFVLEYQEAQLAGQINQISSEQLRRYKLFTLIEECCELYATSLLFIIHVTFYSRLEPLNPDRV